MTETGKITWDENTQKIFSQILEQIPAMVRPIAEIRIVKKVESVLAQANRFIVSEKDLIDAFFAETPPGFVPLMKKGMETLGIDYTKYGHAK